MPRERDFSLQTVREEKFSSAEMTREEEHVHAEKPFKEGECDLCDASVYKEQRPAASPVWVVPKIKLKQDRG